MYARAWAHSRTFIQTRKKNQSNRLRVGINRTVHNFVMFQWFVLHETKNVYNYFLWIFASTLQSHTLELKSRSVILSNMIRNRNYFEWQQLKCWTNSCPLKCLCFRNKSWYFVMYFLKNSFKIMKKKKLQIVVSTNTDAPLVWA